MSDTPNWSFETRQIHAGQEQADPATGARALPIYQTTSYVFNDTDHAKNLFALSELGNIYTRIMNPTRRGREAARLPRGRRRRAPAQLRHVRDILRDRQHRGGRRPRRREPGALRRDVQPVPEHPAEARHRGDLRREHRRPGVWRAATRPNTKLFFGETIANPKSDILDIEAVAAVAHDVGVPLVVDNTIATPYLLRPIEHGADIVVHAATKYLSGHGTTIAGVIVDSGNFDFGADPERFPNYNHPTRATTGSSTPATSARMAPSASTSPSSSRLASSCSATSATPSRRSARSSSGRASRRSASNRPAPRRTPTRSRRSSRGTTRSRRSSGRRCRATPNHGLAQKYLPRGAGRLSFEIAGGLEAGKKFVEGLTLHSHVANIGDVRSLVIHPASTTHSQGPDPDRLAAGVTPGLVRLSVGIEHIDDIIADLEQGFAAAKA